MRKRILFLIPTMSAGGAERVVTTLLRHLDRSVFEPMLGIADCSRTEFTHLVPEDVPIFDLKGQRVRYALPYAVALIWRERPDVVISTLDHMNLALAMSRPFWPPKVKFAARLTSVTSTEHPSHRLTMPLFFRMADVLIYQSESMKARFEAALRLSSIPSVVLHNPVDMELVRRKAMEGASLGLRKPGAFNLVSAGRLDPIKGFDIAIEALALLRDDSITFTIVGDGDCREALQTLIRSRGLEDRVHLAGFQANPYPTMRDADALLLPSRYEGFPNAVLESLAMGTPVISTPVAGMPELLSALPGCAISSDFTPQSLADAIRRAAADRRRPSPDVIAPYSADGATRAYEQVFRRLMGGSTDS